MVKPTERRWLETGGSRLEIMISRRVNSNCIVVTLLWSAVDYERAMYWERAENNSKTHASGGDK